MPRPGGPVPATTGGEQSDQPPQSNEETEVASDRPPDPTGQNQTPDANEISHTALPQGPVEATPVPPTIPQAGNTVQGDAELASTSEQETRKRKRSSDDIDPSESLASDHEYYANQKRRLLGPIAETVTSASISRNPDVEQSKSLQKSPETARADRELERNHQTTSRPPHEKEHANKFNDTLEMLVELPFFPSNPGTDGDGEDERDGDGEETETEQDIDSWIDTRLRTGKARSVVQVVEALRCTSMDPRLADKVLGYLVRGKESQKVFRGYGPWRKTRS